MDPDGGVGGGGQHRAGRRHASGDAAGNNASLGYDAIAPDPARKVDSRCPSDARSAGLAFAGSAPRDTDRDGTGDTYARADAIDVEARFTRPVTVDTSGGTPSLTVRVGTEDRTAEYVSGSGGTVLTFSYTVFGNPYSDTNFDADGGVGWRRASIELNGGAITDAAGGGARAAHPHGDRGGRAGARSTAEQPQLHGGEHQPQHGKPERRRTFGAGRRGAADAGVHHEVGVRAPPRRWW